MSATYINPALPSMIRGLYRADLREKSIQNMLDLAADLVQELIDMREKADQEPSDAESLARDAEEKYPIPAPVDHLTTSDYAMRVVFVQGRRQGYIDARKGN